MDKLFYFEAIVEPIIAEIELASTTSKYRKLVGRINYQMSYTAATLYCSSELFTITQILMPNI